MLLNVLDVFHTRYYHYGICYKYIDGVYKTTYLNLHNISGYFYWTREELKEIL